jgi:probable addiction module antidote protein
MVEVRQTEEFSGWLHRLRDADAVARIVGRMRRMEMGNPGDTRSVGQGILEICASTMGRDTASIMCIAEHRLRSCCVAAISAHATAGHQTGSETGRDILMTKTTRFDAADYLDTEERQVAYIAAALESGDADFVRDALGLVARARGMGGIAKKAGLNRESLYKALGETGNPEFGTVMRIVGALGLTLSAHPAASGQPSKRRRVA